MASGSSQMAPVLLVLVLSVAALMCGAKAQTWDRQFTDPQNAARKAVGVQMPELVWDWNLAKYAQKWADNQASPTNNCRLRHSSGPYGENIFWASWSTTPMDAVKAWLSEKPFYHYASKKCTPGKRCGHYTQIVWKSTTKVGCASAKCPGGGTFTVCSYSPRGNRISHRPY